MQNLEVCFSSEWFTSIDIFKCFYEIFRGLYWKFLWMAVCPLLCLVSSRVRRIKDWPQTKTSNSTNTETTIRMRATSRTTVVLTRKKPLEHRAVTSTGGQKNTVYNKRQPSSKEILPTSQQTFIFRQQFSPLLTMSYFSSRSLQHRRAHDIRYPALYNRGILYMYTFLQNPRRK